MAPNEISERFAMQAQMSSNTRYNAAPSRQMPVFIEDGRRGELMRWGYAPRWLRERGWNKSLINARAEKLASNSHLQSQPVWIGEGV